MQAKPNRLTWTRIASPISKAEEAVQDVIDAHKRRERAIKEYANKVIEFTVPAGD